MSCECIGECPTSESHISELHAAPILSPKKYMFSKSRAVILFCDVEEVRARMRVRKVGNFGKWAEPELNRILSDFGRNLVSGISGS